MTRERRHRVKKTSTWSGPNNAAITSSQNGNTFSPAKEGSNIGPEYTYARATNMESQSMEEDDYFTNQEWTGDGDDSNGSYTEEEEDENPYDYNLDKEAGAHVSHEDLREQLAHLPKVPDKPTSGMRSATIVVDKNIVASRILHLQNRGVIMFTVDFNH